MSIDHPAGHAADRPVRPVVRADVEIVAPPERVFDALTDPAALADWLGGGDENPGAPDDRSRADAGAPPAAAPEPSELPEAGTRWEVPARGPDGRPGRAGGAYGVVERPRRLETTWAPSWEVWPSYVRFDLEPIDVRGVPGTRLTVTHTGPAIHHVEPTTALAAGARTYLVRRGTFRADHRVAGDPARTRARCRARVA